MPDGLVNLSTDVAVQMSKHFLRAMAQPFERSQLGISLLNQEQIQAKNARVEPGLDTAMVL
jgi:DNA excision repair protein ERCC-2